MRQGSGGVTMAKKVYFKEGLFEVTPEFVKAYNRSIALSTLESVHVSRRLFLGALVLCGGMILFGLIFGDLLYWYEVGIMMAIGGGVLWLSWNVGTLTVYSKLTGSKGWSAVWWIGLLHRMRTAVEPPSKIRRRAAGLAGAVRQAMGMAMTTNDTAGPAMDMTITLPSAIVEKIARAHVRDDDGTPLETVADKVKSILFYVTDYDPAQDPLLMKQDMGPPMQLTLTLPAGVVRWLERDANHGPVEAHVAARLIEEVRAAMSAAPRAAEEDDDISL